jgi:hypothetical protein
VKDFELDGWDAAGLPGPRPADCPGRAGDAMPGLPGGDFTAVVPGEEMIGGITQIDTREGSAQYTSHAFTVVLGLSGIRRSIGRTGMSFASSASESVVRTPKTENVRHGPPPAR